MSGSDEGKETGWMYSIGLYPCRRLTAMNAPVLPEVLLGVQPADQSTLDLATEGVLRYLWQSAFGAMLIEVRDDAAFVNGKRVLSMAELRDAGRA